MTNRWRALAFAAIAVLGVGRSGYAGEAQPVKPTDNPHGPLKDACVTCHGSDGWRPAKIAPSFDHAKSGFALEGTHAQTACRACHISLVFARAGTACVSCHQDAHRGELGDDCARCHTPRSFLDRERMRRAHLTTRFPLTGAHLGADCEACHVRRIGRMYVNTPTECVSCHLQDYDATRDPNHVQGGFSQDCADCHRTITFHEVKP
jgi:hypothetical protein